MQLSLTGRRWVGRGEAPLALSPSLLRENPLSLRSVHEAPALRADQFADFGALAARLERAAAHGETVGIFGDYDCDGVTAAALWVRHCRRRGIAHAVRLPHRVRDGYGITPAHVRELAAQRATVLLTVDTGITAHEAAEEARRLGIDLCIVDHHHAPAALPAAHAIVHPARATGLTAPPSAATLSFALIRALEGGPWEGQDDDMALGMLGTVADVMPLVGSNRTLVKEGLRALSRITAGPMADLLRASGVEGECTARDVAFALAPRINAAGRLADPALALEAVLEGGAAVARLSALNTERQEQVEELREGQWRELGVTQELLPADLPAFLVSVSETFSPGIVGLLAGKLTERTGRPSLVGALHGELVTASLRGPRGYDVTRALGRAQALLLRFGGHEQAAGCTFSAAHLEALTKALRADAAAALTADMLCPALEYDAVLENPHLLTAEAVAALKTLEPYGTGNPEPRFVVAGALLQNLRAVGGGAAHLQARVGSVPAIGFRMARLARHAQGPLDVLCRLSLNTWNGRTSPQLVLEDLRLPV